MAKNDNIVRETMLKSIEVEDIIPLFTSGMIGEEDAVSSLKLFFNRSATTRESWDTIDGFISRKLIGARDPWVREVALDFVKRNPKSVSWVVNSSVFTTDELKPFVFLHLIRSFNRERGRENNNRFRYSGQMLSEMRANGLITEKDEERLLVSLHLMKYDIQQMVEESLATT